MTRQELIDRINVQTRRTTCWAIAWLISGVAVLILIGGFIDGSDESQSGLEVVLTAAFLVYVLGGGLAMVLLSYRSLRHSGLDCPTARDYWRSLSRRLPWPLAIAGSVGDRL